MYRVILPDGDLDCETYEHTDYGIELYTGDGEMIAFVPYANVMAVINEEVQSPEDRSIL